MLGVDTNILVRAVLDDNEIESAQARKLLKKAAEKKQLFISSYALLEMVWVLKVKKRTRSEIYESILDLLDSAGVIMSQREIVISALELYMKGKADFGDYLILAESLHHNAKPVASFDKLFCKECDHVLSPKSCLF
jgi:predicted nucleic-acid-binding protein